MPFVGEAFGQLVAHAAETEEKDVFAPFGHFPALNTTYSIGREHKKLY